MEHIAVLGPFILWAAIALILFLSGRKRRYTGIVDFGQRAVFWILIGMAVFSVTTLSFTGTSNDWASAAGIGTVAFLFLFFALASRFLFTGRWRRD